jgi:hypothetical protein
MPVTASTERIDGDGLGITAKEAGDHRHPMSALARFGTMPRLAPASGAGPAGRARSAAPVDRNCRLSLIVFVAVVALAFPLLLKLVHYRWFYLDEWDFLAGRDGGSLHDLLRPHNEHLSALPILVYRGLWRVVGLHSYTPYLTLIITLHLTAAVLLRVVMRRAGVGPWVATAAATVLCCSAPVPGTSRSPSRSASSARSSWA